MHQALYRKYRPSDFSQVAGQDQVTHALKNEVASNNISHAYLFTGVRGTGKTSCARILAKAVNCENPQDGNPCNKCDTCLGIDAGTLPDIIEIDAASNNGVDNIRSMRDEINFLPLRTKYKVYIIDEVHMLSSGAFNALLKTLEEPPAHVIFILATTEVYKLPATIMSRCQRFNFRRIDIPTISACLSNIADKEGFTVTKEALSMLAAAADGGMRDAVSLLDVCHAASDSIDAGVVEKTIGLSGVEKILQLCGYLADGNVSESLSLLSSLYADSKEPERLCEELLSCLRNFMIIKTSKNPEALINADISELELMKKTADRFTLGQIMNSISVVNESLAKMRYSYDKKTEAEMLMISLCFAGAEAQPEPKPKAIKPATEKKSVEQKKEPESKPEEVVAQEEIPLPEPPAAEDDASEYSESLSSAGRQLWQKIVSNKNIKISPIVLAMLKSATPRTDGNKFIIETNSELLYSKINGDSKEDMEKAIAEVTGKHFNVEALLTTSDTPSESKPSQEKEPESIDNMADRFNQMFKNNQ